MTNGTDGIRSMHIQWKTRRAWLLLALLASGCGYATLGTLAGPDGEPLRIELRTFENRSPLVGFEALVADALAEDLLRRHAQVQYNASPRPDVTLGGSIPEGRVLPYTFSSSGLALEYQVGVEIEVSLSAGGNEPPPWKREVFRVEEIYPASSDSNVQLANREQAMRRMAARAAGRIGDELAQGF